MSESLDTWFKREILAHEEALVRYLARKWPKRNEIYDLRQDVYVRVYEAAGKSRPVAPKSFLFTTARNLMVDRVRRQRIVSIDAVGDLDTLDVLVEENSPERRTSAHQDLRRLAQALDELPPRCRETVWLRRVDELSQKEVAQKLGVTQKTVEKHVMKGMKLLARAIFRDALGLGEADQLKVLKVEKRGKPSSD
jgi:RNA polymerase sigma-70 factor (ECF subfamily)